MDVEQVKRAQTLVLKPNKYLVDPNVPFLYQRRGSLMMLMRPRMVLGDDVGLGKTLEAIVALSYLKSAQPNLRALVLTEKIALKQWQAEFAWLTPLIKTKIITSKTHPDPVSRVAAFRQLSADVLISTYSLIYEYSKYVLEGLGPEFVLICDEPNYFKNPSSQLHRKMFEFSKHAQRVYGLTATIIENRLEEAFGIFRVVCPGLISSKVFFEERFCIKRKLRNRRHMVICGYKNLDEFRELIEPGYFGRLQEDPEVKQALPEVMPKDLPVEMSVAQSRKVVEAMDRIVAMPDGSIVNVDILPSLILAQQMVDDPRLKGFDIDSAKTEVLIDALKNSLAGERVLIFCNLRSMCLRLQADLRKAGIESVRVTGLEDETDREEAKNRFMSDDPAQRCNVMIGNRAVVKAVNLQKSGHLFCYDLPWSYGIYRQLVGRLKRTGSAFKVIGVYRLLAVLHATVADEVGTEKTIDHHVLKTLLKKKDLFDAMTGDIKTIESSPSDLLEIWEAVREARHK